MEAFGQLVLAGAFAGWYWTFKKPDNLPANGLLASFYRTVRYHLGKKSLSSYERLIYHNFRNNRFRIIDNRHFEDDQSHSREG